MIDTSNISQERREFFRLTFKSPLEFRSYTPRTLEEASPVVKGISENISQSGVLFQVKNAPPDVSSILWMNLDIRTLKICKEIETRALIFNNGILGRVVRVEEDPKNLNVYNVGVCFITQGQRHLKEVEEILSKVSETK